jgi:hypothetical protein
LLGIRNVFDQACSEDGCRFRPRDIRKMVNIHRAMSAMGNSILEKVFFLWIRRVVYLYLDGFRAMTLGKTLWLVILIKLFVMFVVLKGFFFSDFLQSNFSTDRQRADHVLERITLQTKMSTENDKE